MAQLSRAALTALLVGVSLGACGAPVVPDAATPAPDLVEDTEFATHFAHIPLRVEAWPVSITPAPDGLVDGNFGAEDFVVDASVRRPWSIVCIATDAPVEVAAIVVAGVDGERSPRDVTLLSYLGGAPLREANYPQFIELSTRLGSGTVPQGSRPAVFVLPEPVTAHYVWIRVINTWGGDGLALSEVAALTSEQLAALQRLDGADVAWAEVQADDASSWGGIDLTGLGDVWDQTPTLETDSDAAPADGGSESRDESAPVPAPDPEPQQETAP